tara:strand:+ start:1167 stop:1346 length:180 start_codon:yes stop_codon:yes gene_type:complete
MFLCLIYPVYKFIFILSIRKLNEKDFLDKKNYLKNKAIVVSIIISFIFTYFYSLNIIWK